MSARGVSTAKSWGTPVDMVGRDTGVSASPIADQGEAALVSAARRGDDEAFMAIFDGRDGMLRSLAFRILGDRDQMDDVLQDVALKAFAGMPRFRGEASLTTWLYRITYTTCLNRLRGARPTVSLSDPSDDRQVDSLPDPSSADMADVVIRHIELTAAFASLTPEQRAAVALVMEGGMDYRAAARVMGVPAGTVASRLSAARVALRRFLSDPSPIGEQR